MALQRWTGPSATITGEHGWRTACSTPRILAPDPRQARQQTNYSHLLFAVWKGQYSLGDQIKVQSVERALRHVTQRLVLDGHPDLRQASPGQHSLDLPIAWLIKKFRDEDPPAQPKLAIAISTITALLKNYRMTPHLEAVTDLVIIAFFYLLRVGEYTTPHRARTKRTIALRDCDIRLWHRGKIIPHLAGLRALTSQQPIILL